MKLPRLQARERQALLLGGGPGVDAPAPQDRADAAYHLPVAEGFGYVVVGSNLKLIETRDVAFRLVPEVLLIKEILERTERLI